MCTVMTNNIVEIAKTESEREREREQRLLNWLNLYSYALIFR